MTPRPARPQVALFMGSSWGRRRGAGDARYREGLSQRELAVDLVLLKAEGPYLELAPEDVRLIDLDSRRARTALPNLGRYLRRERPGVLVSTLSVVNVVAILAKLLFARDMPLVVRRAALFFDSVKPRRFQESNDSQAGEASPAVCQRGPHKLLQGVGRPQAERAASRPQSSDDSQSRGLARHCQRGGCAVEHPWFGKSEPPVILAAGRFAREKDHPTLLMAFAEVAKTRPARLVVLGEGQERSNLENLARELGIAHVVDFPGFKLNPFAYMSRASVFAHSSTHEGSPNVLIQAMACGTPVVSTDCPFGPRGDTGRR